MSGGVDSSVAAYLAQRRGTSASLYDEALYEHRRRDIRKTHLLLARRCGGRPRRCLPARDALLRFQFFRGLPRAGHAAVLRGLPPRPHAEPLHRVQPAHEVRRSLFRRAEELGCEKIVTGHYARIARAGERYILQKALDETKDQSYVLYAMTQRELAHTLFPLGAMRKSETRAIAETQGFGNAAQKGQPGYLLCPGRRLAAATGG